MLIKIKVRIEGINSQNDKAEIETEIDILEGVKDINVNEKTGESWIEFDNSMIPQGKIFETIKGMGYEVITEETKEAPYIHEHTYFVKGMHCASCEILIEKRLLKMKGVKSVEASTTRGKAIIEYEGKRPNINLLNQIFRNNGYTFYDQPIEIQETNKKTSIFKIGGIALGIIIGFLILNKLGLSALVNVSSRSSLPSFLFLGLLAGLSTCAALVGGIILSMSKQWLALYSDKDTTWQKLQPHLIFNGGRLASYALLGGLLGAIGSQLRLSLSFSSILVIVVSAVMLLLGLQMLGVKALRKFQITTPKFITRRLADETKFQGRWLPFLMGAATFFLPCGFTITAQGMALLSGSLWQGSLIMLFFALGTTLPLMAIGFSSVKFSAKPHLASTFLKVAGVIVLFFALFNVNAQLNVLGAPSLSNLFFGSSTATNNSSAQTVDNDLPAVVNGKQVIKMEASSYSYKPSYFKVKAGIPVSWEITDTGTSGCTNAIISRSLFDGQIDLTPGQLSVKEFTPEKPGKYKFSCWMGMVSGVIEVVDKGELSNTAATADLATNSDDGVVPSGATGCGCGGGTGSSCGSTQ